MFNRYGIRFLLTFPLIFIFSVNSLLAIENYTVNPEGGDILSPKRGGSLIISSIKL